MNIVRIDKLSFGYGKEQLILKDLTANFQAADFVCIIGPNGSGKSTLLNLLCGFLRAASGSITIADRPVADYGPAALARVVAVVRQEFVPAYGFTVAETVMMGRLPWLGRMGFESEPDRRIAHNAMAATDTIRFSSRTMDQISGGERQRVFIARALAQDTPIMLLDEPTSSLDLKHQVAVFDLLKSLQIEHGKTIVAITHDINLAAQYCDRLLMLGNNAEWSLGPVNEVLRLDAIERVFGVSGFTAPLGNSSFFLPLGRLARDAGEKGRPANT